MLSRLLRLDAVASLVHRIYLDLLLERMIMLQGGSSTQIDPREETDEHDASCLVAGPDLESSPVPEYLSTGSNEQRDTPFMD